MKYIVSILIGAVIAYIQGSSTGGSSDFAIDIQPVMFHFMATSIFFIVAGIFVSFKLSKNTEESQDGQVKFIDEFTVILTAALGIGYSLLLKTTVAL